MSTSEELAKDPAVVAYLEAVEREGAQKAQLLHNAKRERVDWLVEDTGQRIYQETERYLNEPGTGMGKLCDIIDLYHAAITMAFGQVAEKLRK